MSSRDGVLSRIRASLAGLPDATEGLPDHPSRAPAGERVERFAENLQAVDGQLWRADDWEQAAGHVGRICADADAKRGVRSNAAELDVLVHDLDLPLLAWDAAREERLAADVGLTTAQWGIAETGTLVLVSNDEHHRLASLLPPVHVALLRTSCLLEDLGSTLAALRRDGGVSPTVTFVTGPSRTGDIELSLVIGVHGPRELHVVLLDDGPSPQA